jgi:hypothetical protein
VSDPGDHVPEMPSVPLLDDATIDALVDGDRVPHGLDHLAAFAAGVRAVGDRPASPPSPELAALLTHGAPAAAPGRPIRAVPRHTRRRSVLAKAAGLGLAAKISVATTAAAAGVVGAGAAGVLPGSAGGAVRDAIEAVTPVEFSDRGDRPDERRRGTADQDTPDGVTGEADDPSLPGEHGDRVSSDATGEADGEPGVDGPTVADQAPGATHRPAEQPGQSGVTPPTSSAPGTPGGSGDTPAATAPAAGADGVPPSTTPPAADAAGDTP